jgi:hypothetical protein
MKPNSAAVEQMILASSKSSRQAMGNLRSGSQPFAPLQKEVKENIMVRKPSAAPASAIGAVDPNSAATSKAQHPKSRWFCLSIICMSTFSDSSSFAQVYHSRQQQQR